MPSLGVERFLHSRFPVAGSAIDLGVELLDLYPFIADLPWFSTNLLLRSSPQDAEIYAVEEGESKEASVPRDKFYSCWTTARQDNNIF